jgi:class 3 adenylate cyclase
MDRHDMQGTSAAEVAEAHRKDLAIQEQFGVKFLTYWFDEQRGTGFCLIDAPDEATAEQVHKHAHGHVAAEIIPVDISAVEAFLGRIHDPKPAGQPSDSSIDGGFRAVMFTDIVGSIAMTARLGDAMAVELVRTHDALVRRALAQHGGREIKHTGDGIMASFDAPPAAPACARTIQRALDAYNRAGREPIHVRIGIHAGEPVAHSNDLFGATVQLASRLCAAAQADRIWVSEEIRAACGDRASFVDAGMRTFKGFPEPVRVFEVLWR